MSDLATLPGANWAIAVAAVFFGTVLQRLAGQGFGMITAPVLVMVAPDFVPATLLVLGLLVGLSSTAVDLSALNRRELPPGMVGRALGAVIAAWIASHLTGTAALGPMVAIVVYFGIALSVVGVRIPVNPYSLFLAGNVSGVMGTLTAVGAPPMALLYQHHRSREAAAMQNAFFFWGMVVSILALAVVGLIGLRHVVFAAALSPAVALALLAARPLARRFAGTRIRPIALGLAGIAATVLLLR